MKQATCLLLVLLLLTGCTPQPRFSAPERPRPLPAYTAPHVELIRQAQRSSGAIAMTPGGSAINPYFANLSARALLKAPDNLAVVEAYMDWYLGHLNQDGTIDDYRVEAGAEVTTGDYDSSDSYAATFLSLVDAWVAAGGNPEWVRRNRAALDRVAGAIVAVTDRDGLTWAKPGYPAKLLMDNCEVYRGWTDWAHLLDGLGDRRGARTARERAERIRRGLAKLKQPAGLWAWALTKEGTAAPPDMTQFYPDAVAQLFPLIFGLTTDDAGYHAFDASHPAWRNLEAGDFPWLLPIYAAALAGDQPAVEQALAAVREGHQDLTWPWYIAESAWVIEAGGTALVLN